jgi:hypothetical protein
VRMAALVAARESAVKADRKPVKAGIRCGTRPNAGL